MGTSRARTMLCKLLAFGLLATLLISSFSVPLSAPLNATQLAQDIPPLAPGAVRFATFNASLNRFNAGDLITDLSTPDNEQAQQVAEIIQRTNPDVLLINEFDYNEAQPQEAADLFRENYLEVSQNGASPVAYPHVYVAPSNTGIASGLDLDNSGDVGETGFAFANDAFGFGFFPGQFGMVLFSKYPIVTDDVRTFQEFLWNDMPDAALPDDPDTEEPADWYSAEELDAVRLSSKSHWDVPINVDGTIIHALVSHPTPPVFDGPEDRNGLRNHDEIRFWSDYITPGRGDYIYDDSEGSASPSGGLPAGTNFVVMGDQNADPFDGDSTNNAIHQLLYNPLMNLTRTPAAAGGVEQAAEQGLLNTLHKGDPAFDTSDFGDSGSSPGNLRVDYVLPSKSLTITEAGIYWPTSDSTFFALVNASDHRLVWVDVKTQEENTLPNGVAAGDVDQDSAVLWARSTAAGELVFTYSSDPLFASDAIEETVNVTEVTQPVKLEISGLNPDTTYYYRVTDAAGTTADGQFTTAATSESFRGLRFGVTGDWRGDLAPYPGLSNANGRALEFLVAHGDTYYADVSSPTVPISQARTLEDYRLKNSEVYSSRLGINTWSDLRSVTPILATIDDHEVTNDFAGGAPPASDATNEGNSITPGVSRFGTETTGFINDSDLYETGMQAFQEYNPIREERYGETGDERTADEIKLYRYRTYGKDAAVMVLDNRSFRDAQLENVTDLTNPLSVTAFLAASFSPTRTMLGDAQLTDLKADLLMAQDAGITWKFIMVPEPIQNLGVLAAADRFEGYAAERTEILQFIDDNNIENVVFVAADIHGTVVNNLAYQTAVGGEQITVNAFEISTGSLAYYEPLGQTSVDLAIAAGVLTDTTLINLYESLPIAPDLDDDPDDKDDFFKSLLNEQLTPLNYPTVGLQDSPIDAELLQGDYAAAHTYGWTDFDIAPDQSLTITTYGIDPYSPTEAANGERADGEEIIGIQPRIVSQFVVNPAQVSARIRDIQGSAHTSPLEGTTVTDVPGVVTALDGDDGFYMQDPAPDNNIATSEGIFVFTDSTPAVAVGDEVRVSGIISEFGFGDDLTTTQISITTSPAIESNSNTLPEPIIIGDGGRTLPTQVIDNDGLTLFEPAEDGIDFYESLEGMRVQVNDAVAVSGTSRFGEIAVLADNGTGAGVRSARGGIVIQPDDFNPERILIDDSLVFDEPDVNVGDSFTAPIVGVMNYTFGNFKLFNTEALPAVTATDLPPETTSAPGENELSVATFNVLNLDPGDGQEKFDALATQIITHMQAPDIIGLQEIQDNSGEEDDGTVAADQTYSALSAAIGAAGGPTYEYRDIAPVNNQDGGAPGSNIRVGFLYNPDRVSFVDRAGGDATTAVEAISTTNGLQLSISPGRIDPTNPAFAENEDTGFDGTRRSLAGEFVFKGNTVFVIANHFKSKRGDDSLFGSTQPPSLETEEQRIAQAQVVNDFVDSLLTTDPNAHIVVLGDFNDFEFSPPLEALAGDVLTNLVATLPLPDRYTFIFDGNSQVLDNILVSNNLSDTVEVDIVHINVDYANDDPARASDHEPIVARIGLPDNEPGTPGIPIPPHTPGESVTISMTLLAEGSRFEQGTAILPPDIISGTDTISPAVAFIFREINSPTRGFNELINPTDTITRSLVGAFELRLLDSAGNDITGELTTPISLTLIYRSLPPDTVSDTLTLFRYDADTGQWTTNNLEVVSSDVTIREVLIALSHLSEYALTVEQRSIASGSTIYLPIILR